MNQFEKLRTANIARNVQWNPENAITPTFRGLEAAGEMGEACNVLKKLEREKMGLRGSRASKQQLASELADVVICLDLIAMDYGIDLWSAVVGKFNATSNERGLTVFLEID